MFRPLELSLRTSPVFFLFFTSFLTADIGFIDTGNATTSVVYEEDGTVYFRDCTPAKAPPLNRDCTGVTKPGSVPLQKFLSYFHSVGSYSNTSTGLDLAERARVDAEKSGNMEVANRLRGICENIKKNLALAEDLEASSQGTTFYEYQDEFRMVQRGMVTFEGKVWCNARCDLKETYTCTSDNSLLGKRLTTPRRDAYYHMRADWVFNSAEEAHRRANEICNGSSELIRVTVTRDCGISINTKVYLTFSKPEVTCR